MRSPLRSRRFAAIVITAAALSGLTACTGSPAGSGSTAPSSNASTDAGSAEGGQTTEEACQLVQGTLDDAMTQFEQSVDDDPQAAEDTLRGVAEDLADAGSEITNEEVAAIVPDLQQVFEKVADIVPSIAEGDATAVNEFEEIGEDLSQSVQRYQELCEPVG